MLQYCTENPEIQITINNEPSRNVESPLIVQLSSFGFSTDFSINILNFYLI